MKIYVSGYVPYVYHFLLDESQFPLIVPFLNVISPSILAYILHYHFWYSIHAWVCLNIHCPEIQWLIIICLFKWPSMTGELLIAYHAFKFPIKNARLRKLCGAQLFGASCEKTWSYPLVVITGCWWFGTEFYFFIPTDELIFFRGVGIPPTSW